MRMKRIIMLLLLALLLAGCAEEVQPTQGSSNLETPILECNFADSDFSQVVRIQLYNATNGQKNQISDGEDIAQICNFLKSVSGTNGISSKGYYGAWYTLTLYDAEGKELYQITFNGDHITYGYDFSDKYPTRYEMTNPTEEEVVSFFGQYDSSVE